MLHDFVISGIIVLDVLFLKLKKITDNMSLTTLRISIDDCLLDTPGISIESFK